MRAWLWPILLCPLLLPGGCSDPLQEENEKLRNEIITVHDLAMDKIGYMYALETRLRNLEPSAELTQETIESRITALQEANRAMFKWMNQYQTLFIAEDLAEDNRYRQEQLVKIETLERMTSEAISAAEQLLSTN